MSRNKEVVSSKNAPKAIGAYSQAVKIGNFLFTSGQIPIDPATNEVVKGNFREQVKQVMKNIKAIIEESGGNIQNTIKICVYLIDLDKFSEFNEVYQSFFTPPYPARTTVEVSNLPKKVQIEVDAIAYLENDNS